MMESSFFKLYANFLVLRLVRAVKNMNMKLQEGISSFSCPKALFCLKLTNGNDSTKVNALLNLSGHKFDETLYTLNLSK